MGYLDIMNSKLLYILCMGGLLVVAGLCVITILRAWRRASELNIGTDKLKMVLRSSLLYSIVPSLSIVIGLFSLAPVLGIPWSWFRLSILGAVNYELMSADMIATASGYESIGALAQANDPTLISSIMFTMSICIMTGLIASLLFGKKLHNNITETSKNNPQKGAITIACFSLAIAVVFGPMQFFQGSVKMLTMITSIVITIAQMIIIRKYNVKWLLNFTLSNALIISMASSLLWTSIFA